MASPEPEAELTTIRGDDGTLRRFRRSSTLEYIETQCSYSDCGEWFVASHPSRAQYHSNACRMRAALGRRQAQRETPLTDDPRASG